MGSSLMSIIILAGIALFLVVQLRNALGTRSGFEPEQIQPPARPGPKAVEPQDEDIADFVPEGASAAQALAAVKEIEPDFSVRDFVVGARKAYEMILMAFEAGDRGTLQMLLSEEVYESFDAAITARQEKGLTVSAEFFGVREADIDDAAFDPASGEVEITLRFVGELSSEITNAEGVVVEGGKEVHKQRDLWTFARIVGHDDPNWKLIATQG